MGFILSIRSIYILPSEKGTSLVRWQDIISIHIDNLICCCYLFIHDHCVSLFVLHSSESHRHNVAVRIPSQVSLSQLQYLYHVIAVLLY